MQYRTDEYPTVAPARRANHRADDSRITREQADEAYRQPQNHGAARRLISLTAIVGARPNFVKMAPLLEEAGRRASLHCRLVHTGQHYSPEMSATFFDELGMPAPDVNLEIGSGSHTAQTAGVMLRLEVELNERRPDLVLVVGDVNSTMAAALVASKLGIPVAHVEAGLRSFDRSMPEETNRLVTDTLSDYLFASEPSGVANLLAEGIPQERIFLVGNVMIDTLLKYRDKAAQTGVLEQLGLTRRNYAVATLHRPSNVDGIEHLASLMNMLTELARHLPVVFPVHPRTRERMEHAGLTERGVILMDPLGYLEFLRLTSEARLVLTDSGGIQEETTILQVPCLTMRENTERPITIEQGTNRLVGTDPEKILRAALDTLDAPPRLLAPPALWDGKASARILDVLERSLGAFEPHPLTLARAEAASHVVCDSKRSSRFSPPAGEPSPVQTLRAGDSVAGG
jgi:UDP-N-acetylglucosamine 2-epimerase (non-hydrolysing)